MEIKKIIFGLSFLALVACSDEPKSKESLDTTTSGEITVSCDESLKPIIEAEHMVFEELHPKAKINMVYMSEYDAIQYMLKDSARLAIVTRELNEDELKVLKNQKISKARYHKIGYDAIAFILNTENTDTSFSLAQIKGLLSGEISTWNQVNPASKLGAIQVVFDSPKSGAIRYLEDSVLNGKSVGKNCFALSDNPAVLEYVQKNKNAIGIIGVSWISDVDDSQTKFFLNNIKVAEVEPVIMRVAGITNKPIQGNIALKQYPYWRNMKVVSREMRSGLGTGFASFMESEPGQKIILKGGLVPQRSSIRTINLN
ncbi:MAG: substrate-binding domain-containing protein [Bacteroidia bacterium]|nr:substrate-binding domain-containing protein [Bacteroidia bacterium]